MRRNFSLFDVNIKNHHISPGHIIVTHIGEQKEALGRRCVRTMCAQQAADRPQCAQIDHMNVHLLGDGRRLQHVGDATAARPAATVHVQMPVVGTERHADDVAVQIDDPIRLVEVVGGRTFGGRMLMDGVVLQFVGLFYYQ